MKETAAQYGLDPRLVRAVVRVESAWNPRAVSRKDARGLMQLIPTTAERFNVRNVFNPSENVEGGVHYLAELLARYHGDLTRTLAAYYAGERAVDRAGGVPRDPATRDYVHQVTHLYVAATETESPGAAPIHRMVESGGLVVYTNE